MKNKIIILLLLSTITLQLHGVAENMKEVVYLSGKGAFDTKTWDFFCTGGRKSGSWGKIEVPSCWEQQGYGNYEYGRNGYSYGPKYKYADEKGIYKLNFRIPESWKKRVVKIVFEGSMTDTEVKINGITAGEIHQGSFYRFSYDITDKLKWGDDNELEVTVSKLSSNESVNRAERYGDYWNFGGIYRPVYLESLPVEHIERLAIDARADGSFSVNLFPKNLRGKRTLTAEITDSEGRTAGTSEITANPTDSIVNLTCKVTNPLLWTSETPNQYRVVIRLKEGKKDIYVTSRKFGFRTIEVRHGKGIYINGKEIRIKGINRHSFWPETGRTLNRDICLMDVRLIKEMNMNAVRMSHYPPDEVFLDICDSLGLYVLDEIAGWQRAYDTPVGKKIVKETVIRDVNHPSVIFWVNGNEGGTNRELDGEFLIHDPSGRDVLHAHHRPGNAFNGIDCNHYENYASAATLLKDSLIYMPTEFLHCQDDGGGGAGLYDYWELLWTADRSGGGFLWAMVDEGLVRTDMNGFIDTDRLNGPDGVMGPHREKEGSFFAIREIYSPVRIEMKRLPSDFDGDIPVENRYHFTNLDKCTFSYRLADFNKPADRMPGYSKSVEKSITAPSVAPEAKGVLKLGLTEDWKDYDVLILTAYDPFKNEIYSWTWQIKTNRNIVEGFILRDGEKASESISTDSTITLRANGTSVMFSKKDGSIIRITYNNRTGLNFGNGPVLTTGKSRVSDFSELRENDGNIVEFRYTGDLKSTRWKMYNSGWLSLEYEYQLEGSFNYAGISFSYPENWVIRARWLGNGPGRVWKNRLHGVTFNLREKVFNDTQTGAYPFFYPEFKGYFSDFTWLELSTAQGKIHIATEDQGLFLRLYDFYGITGPKSFPELPPGDISILDCIPALGSKLATGLTTDASVYGPAGKINELSGLKRHKLWFYFGVPGSQ